jgi:hypothetical protein
MKVMKASNDAGFRAVRTNADTERTQFGTKTGCGRTRTNTIVCPVRPHLSAGVRGDKE